MAIQVNVVLSVDGDRRDLGTLDFDTVPEPGDYFYSAKGQRHYVSERHHVEVASRVLFQILVTPA